MKAIVVMYNGKEVTPAIIELMCSYFAQAHRMVTSVDVFNDEDVAAALMQNRKEALIVDIQDEQKEPSTRNAEENAIIVVGTAMREALEHFNPLAFGSALIEKINRVRKNPNRENNRAFMNALFVLSQEDLNISQSLLEEYNMDSQKIAIIKSIYNTMLAN